MIFKFDSTFTDTITEQELSDICSLMIAKRQYIDCTESVKASICQAIENHGSTTQKELLYKYKRFDITNELRNYLQTIDLSSGVITLNELKSLLSQPSRLLVENGPYEWEVYKSLIGTYKNDRDFKNLFLLLEEAKHDQRITEYHAGGCTTFPAIIEQQNNSNYKNIAQYKFCTVFDRDSDDEHTYDKNKNNLFDFFCQKAHTNITENDIYTLIQNGYIWHMWYKRTIENYFPNQQYEKLDINTSNFPITPLKRDYFKINQHTANGYQKGSLPLLVEGMSRNDYEIGLKRFTINGKTISEIQLFLLKLVKVI